MYAVADVDDDREAAIVSVATVAEGAERLLVPPPPRPACVHFCYSHNSASWNEDVAKYAK